MTNAHKKPPRRLKSTGSMGGCPLYLGRAAAWKADTRDQRSKPENRERFVSDQAAAGTDDTSEHPVMAGSLASRASGNQKGIAGVASGPLLCYLLIRAAAWKADSTQGRTVPGKDQPGGLTTGMVKAFRLPSMPE